MAATSTLLRLNKSPLHALIQKHLLRPSLAAGAATKLFDISADSQLPIPNSALSQPLIGAVFQPTWNLPFGMSMEHSRMEVRGRAVTPDREEYEDSDGDEDSDGEFGDGDVNDFDEDEDEDLSEDADYEDDDK